MASTSLVVVALEIGCYGNYLGMAATTQTFSTNCWVIILFCIRSPHSERCSAEVSLSVRLTRTQSSTTTAIIACNMNNALCTASDDSCGGGLGTRLLTRTAQMCWVFDATCMSLTSDRSSALLQFKHNNYDNRTTVNPHNPLYVLHRWY